MRWCSAWTWRLILANGLLFLMASCGGEEPAPFTQWTVIDVNNTTLQGDAHLLRSGDEALLVDAWYAAVAKDQVLGYLQSKGIDHNDRAFLSHPHADHYEGFSVLLKNEVMIDEFFYDLLPSEVSDCCYPEPGHNLAGNTFRHPGGWNLPNNQKPRDELCQDEERYEYLTNWFAGQRTVTGTCGVGQLRRHC